ncbi:hypothetical protein F5884DRAFT_897418 [Xylogone sp. PMI_703]|nr:hypothetical protein F5884DRAFT_897418 [Xylogone sp. PMI_703]
MPALFYRLKIQPWLSVLAFSLLSNAAPTFNFTVLDSDGLPMLRPAGLLARATSQDPSCPAGFLCNKQSCPGNIICPEGEVCINFEGVSACMDPGLQLCAFNPSTFQAVGCANNGVCCHGNCYTSGTGQTCGSSSCQGTAPPPPPPPPPPSSTTSKPAATTTTRPPPPPPPPSSTTKPPTLPTSTTTSTTKSTTKSTTTTSVAQPTQVSSSGAFGLLGCFADSTTDRVLQEGSKTDTTGMTVEACISLATQAGAKFAGVEFAQECYWGNTLVDASTANSGDCNMACTGNNREVCGGGNRILIYQNPSWVDPACGKPVCTPSVVPNVGTFTELGCLTDTSARILKNGSSTDSGMTVEKCIGLAQSWQYAGVEFADECYWGDIIFSDSIQNQDGCKMACAGDATELCGDGFQILTYQDQDWINPTTQDLVNALDEYVSAVQVLRSRVNDWQTAVNNFNAASSKKLKRDPPNIQLVLDARSAVLSLNPSINGLRQRIDETELSDFNRIDSEVTSTFETVASDAAASPATWTPLVQGVIVSIGIAATATVVATGLFLLFSELRDLLDPDDGNGSGGSSPPSQTTSQSQSAAPTISIGSPAPPATSTTCSPTNTPTSVIVLTTRDSTRAEYDDLIRELVEASTLVTDQIVFDNINYRAFTASKHDCNEDLLLKNPIISTVSRPITGLLDDFINLDAGTVTKREDVSGTAINLTTHSMARRDIPAGSPLSLQSGELDGEQIRSPFHLNYLTAPGAQTGLAGTGTYYAFEDYVFDSTAPSIPVYVMDTGASIGHQDISSNVAVSYDATIRNIQADVVDVDQFAHGTCMSSCVGGKYAGVHKNTEIIPVRIMETGGAPPFLSDVIYAIGAVLNDRKLRPNQNLPGVLSMSFGFDPNLLQVEAGQANSDPFTDLLSRMTAANIVPVASTGNDENADLSVATPRKHGGSATSLIVVGAVDNLGNRWSHTTHLDSSGRNIASVYANGVDIVCAHAAGPNIYRRQSGSSPATATVAGMIAYYLSRGLTTPALAKGFLIQEATRLKGNWADGIPRVGLLNQVTCTPEDPNNVDTIPRPTFEEPDAQVILDGAPTQLLTGIDPDSLPFCGSV